MIIHYVQNLCKKHVGFPILFLIVLFPFTMLFAKKVVSVSSIESKHISSSRSTKVLFIGNSYTYFNNLPRILEQLSASTGMSVETKMIVEGGLTLQDQWEKGDALKAIREGSWDYVILQDQSALGAYIINGQGKVGDPQYFHKYARLFDQEIKKSRAKTIFYLTWALKDAPEREQTALNYAYMSIARELKDKVAPVGIVWQKVRRNKPNLELYIEDKSHPKDVGSYIAACVLYAAIFGKSPIGLPYNITGNPVDVDGNVDTKKETSLVALSAADAKLIQQTAWQTYQSMRASGGYISAPTPPPLDLPKLLKGQKPSIEDLEGIWIGKLKFYPVPWAATMELKLRQEDGEWKSDLKIKFEGNPNADKAPQITNFKITETGISFIDAKGISGAPMKYEAAFNNNTLSGIAEVKVEDQPIYAIGTWELKRQE